MTSARFFPPTIILRHRKENLKKCSLRGLEKRDDLIFLTYPKDSLPPMDGYIVLDINGPPLSDRDRGCGLFIIDATWRYAAVMAKKAPLLPARSLPRNYRTVYPRRQNDCPFPGFGLASVEALYLAYAILQRDTSGILDGYYWKEEFLRSTGLFREYEK